MSTKLLSKNEVRNFNLWTEYYKYLLSLQAAIKDHVQKKLGNDVEVDSWIESLDHFFNKSGQTTDESPESPLLEEIYFNLPNYLSKVRICITSGNTTEPQIELVKDKRQPNYPCLKDEFCKTADVLSKDMILTMAEWLRKGHISNPVMLDKFRL